MKKTANLNLRIKPGLKSRLVELAYKDNRSVNSYVEIILEKHTKTN
jgi:predicted HicB family RNase H-like nuclease